MIELNRVSVSYGDIEALHDLSLTVARGEWIALVGPNGAGKTSALRALAGLVPFGGEIVLAGCASGRLEPRERARLVAFVPQKPAMPQYVTVAEYVRLGRTPHISYLGTEAKRDRDAAETAVRRLQLESLAERPLGSLSGGEFQRAVLARALAQEAPLLLLDEPTTSLDLGRQQLVLELVDGLRGDGLTVVSTMHDLTLAGQYADRLVLLARGRMAAVGSTADVLSAANLDTHYGARVRVVRDGDDVFVLPVRR